MSHRPDQSDAFAAAVAAMLALPGQIAELRAERARDRAMLERIAAALPPSLVSLDEAARALGISRSTAKRLVARGELRSTRIGRQVRVDLAGARPLGLNEVTELAAKARGR